MKLSKSLGSYFSQPTRNRGNAYVATRKLTLQQEFTAGAIYLVRGTTDYTVCLDWQDADAEEQFAVSCTCPHYYDGFLCKHVWAAIVHLSRSKKGPQSADFDLVGDDPDELEEELRSRPPAGAGGSQLRRSLNGISPQGISHTNHQSVIVSPSSSKETWQETLKRLQDEAAAKQGPDDIPRHPAAVPTFYYMLDVGATLYRNQVAVSILCGLSSLGEQRSPKPFQIRSYEIGRHWEPADQRLLRLISSVHRERDRYVLPSPYQAQSQFEMSGEDFVALAPQLCETGRFHWRLGPEQPFEDTTAITWDNAIPYGFRLKAESEKNGWRVSGELQRGDDLLSLPGNVVLAMSEFVLLSDGRLSRANLENSGPWLQQFLEQPSFHVPRDEGRTFLENVWSFPECPQLSFPPELQPAVEEITPAPIARFRSLKDDDFYFEVLVSFDYAGREIEGSAPAHFIMDEGVNKCYPRNFATEALAHQFLDDVGTHVLTSYDNDELIRVVPRDMFLQAAIPLIDAGWQVEGEQGLLRKSTAETIEVKSNIDWFELETEVQFGDQSVKTPALLRAVRRKERFVSLDDGTQGVIPAEWLQRFGELANFSDATQTESLRFQPSQAMVLDALLEAEPQVSFDKAFSSLVKRLQDSTELKPAKEPRTFKGTLREYQRNGLGWISYLQSIRCGGCLADDMGLGKTIQVLATLEKRRQSFGRKNASESHRPTLAVVPKSLVFNWMDEAARFTPKLRVMSHHGTGRSVDANTWGEFDLIITTYGTLRKDIEAIREIEFDYIVLDEATAIKNSSSLTAKACRLLKGRHRLALSGTPIENHLGELWSLFEFLNPGLLGNEVAFKRRANSIAANPESQKLLSRAIAPFVLRRTKSEVLTELPDKSEQILYCDLVGKQRKGYDELRDYYRVSLAGTIAEKGLKNSKIHVLEALLRLRQAACHPGLVDEKQAKQSSAKLQLLWEQLENTLEEGHKALIFSQFTSLLAILRRQLDQRGIKYAYLDGRTNNRKECVTKFQSNEDCKLFLISLKAGGHGLNLTAADHVFILDPWWNPAVEAQAIDRAHRMGQQNPVFVYRIIARDTVEEKVLELQQGKRELAEAIVTSNSNLIRSLTKEDLSLLLS
ncbi:MAG: SNF2 helicase associated domain-containing protein [Planctomycetaceae bacterium]|nr:SNF2 helicase associated domain-containing protein [Planctomycetaceae bacterium]